MMRRKYEDYDYGEFTELEEELREKNLCPMCSLKLGENTTEWRVDPINDFIFVMHVACCNKIFNEFKIYRQMLVYKAFQNSKYRYLVDAIFNRDY